jgi:hypothetical protein
VLSNVYTPFPTLHIFGKKSCHLCNDPRIQYKWQGSNGGLQ